MRKFGVIKFICGKFRILFKDFLEDKKNVFQYFQTTSKKYPTFNEKNPSMLYRAY